MIRVLQSVSFLHRAGLETMLMNYYRHINRENVQFDFLINKDIEGAYEEEAKELGARMFRTPGFNPVKYFKYKRYMLELFNNHPEIKIVHGHNDLEYIPLKWAKHAGIKVRIAHSHNTKIDKGLKYPIKLYCKNHIKKVANHYWGCSLAAIEFYYGKNVVKDGNYFFLKNAIELPKFKFNPEVRDRIRKEYNLEGKTVIGHVGRFTYQKNHGMLLDIFYNYHKKNPDSVLLLIGDGSLKQKIVDEAWSLGIMDSVIIISSIPNVNEFYQAMDAFVMPSWYEGLPVVGIEAQAAGLPCIFSDVVTKETQVSSCAQFYPLEKSPQEWADFIDELVKEHERKDTSEELTTAGYNIEIEAAKLETMYMKMYEDSCR